MSANRKSFKLNSDKEACNQLQIVLMWLWNTPSAADKLPKFVMEPAYMLEEYTAKHGWDWLLDGDSDG